MKFSSTERTLFSELVVQTVISLEPSRIGSAGRGRKLTSPATFAPGDYVGGQADMSHDQEKHLMLEYCGVIGSDLKLRFDRPEMKMHLENNAEKFGIDLTWVIECFCGAVAERHSLGWDCVIFSPKRFIAPLEFEQLFDSFIEAGYAKQSGQFVIWTKKMMPIMGMSAWGVFTEYGEEARSELRAIWSAMPSSWRQRVLEAPRPAGLLDELQDILSNHWYRGAWHDIPIRGSNNRIYLRHSMHDRAYYLWQMATGNCEYAI